MTLYKDYRDAIKTGDMLLFRNNPSGGIRARIERWLVTVFTQSIYTHVGLAWVDGDRRVWVMDMTTKGCAPRLLSKVGDFDLIPCPRPLSSYALRYAHDCFGEWQYSRLQAVLGFCKALAIGKDAYGQCAEYVIAVLRMDGMAPTNIATPAACAQGAQAKWPEKRVIFIKNEA